jgi:hypothetical protein
LRGYRDGGGIEMREREVSAAALAEGKTGE